MKPGDPTNNVSCHLSPELVAAMRAQAEAEGISRSVLMQRAIAAYVAQRTETKTCG